MTFWNFGTAGCVSGTGVNLFFMDRWRVGVKKSITSTTKRRTIQRYNHKMAREHRTVSNLLDRISAENRQAQLEEREARNTALRHIIEAWDEALHAGVYPEHMASAMLYAAITELVGAHGEEVVADMIAALPERIRCGEYTLYEQRH